MSAYRINTQFWGDSRIADERSSSIASQVVSSPVVDNPQDTPGESGGRSRSRLPETDLTVRHGVTEQNVGEVLAKLRTERNLRELTAVESGQPMNKVSAGTYFFLYARYIDGSSPGAVLPRVGKKPVSRYQSVGSYYFELHITHDKEIYLICFVDEIQAAKVARLSGAEDHEIVVSAFPWGQMTSLVSIPLVRIQVTRAREIEISERNQTTVLDLTLR